ncbi:MAG TPA: DUF2934 domain-containing protein [Bryobacteraceae bacterium]|nr:DUF2934 domain-containing protein [Bryobacteraceae bacterium]
MPKVEVTIAESDGSLAKGLRADFDALMQRVRKRAYELFEQRGRKDGADLDDWFCAEQELLSSAKVETQQEPGQYILRLSMPGFSGKDLKVYTLGDTLIVKGLVREKSEAEAASAEQSRSIFYQWPLPARAHSNEITAEYKQEGLTITVPVEAQAKPVAVEASKNSQAGAAAA